MLRNLSALLLVTVTRVFAVTDPNIAPAMRKTNPIIGRIERCFGFRNEVAVAVCDSGCMTGHQDIRNNVIGGINLKAQIGYSGSGHLDVTETINFRNLQRATHGTAVTGTIVNVSPGTTVAVLKAGSDVEAIQDQNLGTVYQQLVTNKNQPILNNGNPTGYTWEQAKIINMSFGKSFLYNGQPYQVQFDNQQETLWYHLISNGYTLVVSAGNDGVLVDGAYQWQHDVLRFIKRMEAINPVYGKRIIFAGATQYTPAAGHKVASYSNRMRGGLEDYTLYTIGNVYVADSSGGRSQTQGTSFSAPAISGALAHLCNTFGISPDDARDILFRNADTTQLQVDGKPWDLETAKLVNMENAMKSGVLHAGTVHFQSYLNAFNTAINTGDVHHLQALLWQKNEFSGLWNDRDIVAYKQLVNWVNDTNWYNRAVLLQALRQAATRGDTNILNTLLDDVAACADNAQKQAVRDTLADIALEGNGNLRAMDYLLQSRHIWAGVNAPGAAQELLRKIIAKKTANNAFGFDALADRLYTAQPAVHNMLDDILIAQAHQLNSADLWNYAFTQRRIRLNRLTDGQKHSLCQNHSGILHGVIARMPGQELRQCITSNSAWNNQILWHAAAAHHNTGLKNQILRILTETKQLQSLLEHLKAAEPANYTYFCQALADAVKTDAHLLREICSDAWTYHMMWYIENENNDAALQGSLYQGLLARSAAERTPLIRQLKLTEDHPSYSRFFKYAFDQGNEELIESLIAA